MYENIALGNKIRSIRIEKGLSMEAFGKLLNASKGNVSMWESGKVSPNNERLKAIADLAGITVKELLGEKPNNFEFDDMKRLISDFSRLPRVNQQDYMVNVQDDTLSKVIDTVNQVGGYAFDKYDILDLYKRSCTEHEVHDLNSLIELYKKVLNEYNELYESGDIPDEYMGALEFDIAKITRILEQL